ncbi:MAG: Hsp20/alpha crystallin family protein [Bacteroidetes bacterium]|nr:Hsp20/alpha crystallin family protein [Bacteroidota bacterium]
MSLKSLLRANSSFPETINDLFKPMNEWLDDAFWNKPMLSPAVNISESDKEYTMTVAAPGMKKDDFKVDVENGTLSISAKIEENKEEKEKNYTRKEYNYSSFSRSFSIPESVKEDQIEASYNNGVLTLTLPKEETKTKKNGKSIAVK